MRIGSVRLLTLLAALGLSFGIVSCDEKKKKKSGGAFANASTGELGTSNSEFGETAGGTEESGSGESTGGGAGEDSNGYSPFKGDLVKRTMKSKTWASGADEPSDWASETTMQTEVLGLYKEGSSCDYRVKNTTSTGGMDVATDADKGCTTLQCGDPVETESTCTQEAIDAIDVGDFKAVPGTRMICTSILDIPTVGKNTTTSVTDTWSHTDVRDEMQTVKSMTKSCTSTFQEGDEEDPSKTNICDASDRDITYTVSETVIEENVKGDSEERTLEEPVSAFTVSGDIADATGDNVQTSANCSLTPELNQFVPEKINITLTKSFCQDGVQKNMNFIIGVESQGAGGMTTNSGMISDPNDLTKMFSGDCKLDLSGDEDAGTLSGTITCDQKLKPFQGSGEVEISDAEFSCAAPGDLDYSKLGDSDSDGGSGSESGSASGSAGETSGTASSGTSGTSGSGTSGSGSGSSGSTTESGTAGSTTESGTAGSTTESGSASGSAGETSGTASSGTSGTSGSSTSGSGSGSSGSTTESGTAGSGSSGSSSGSGTGEDPGGSGTDHTPQIECDVFPGDTMGHESWNGAGRWYGNITILSTHMCGEGIKCFMGTWSHTLGSVVEPMMGRVWEDQFSMTRTMSGQVWRGSCSEGSSRVNGLMSVPPAPPAGFFWIDLVR